ncbi:MAG TPA: hypothetical protein VIM73_09790, partial [Polyangiaceae bacterium]
MTTRARLGQNGIRGHVVGSQMSVGRVFGTGAFVAALACTSSGGNSDTSDATAGAGVGTSGSTARGGSAGNGGTGQSGRAGTGNSPAGGSSASAGADAAGQGGTGGAAEASGGGGASGLTGMHCTPGTPVQVYPYSTVMPCFNEDFYRPRLPNEGNMSVRGIELKAPAAAGERFAFSVEHVGSFVLEEGIESEWAYYSEIWGTNERCGLAMELLWWGPERSGIYCGEFTPSESYTHLLHVRRQRYGVVRAASSDKFIGLCNAGTCPSGAEGQGLEPGGKVEPPLVYGGAIQRVGRTLDVRVGTGGRLLLVT